VTPPDVRVVRGEPDETELAALVAGLVATSADHDHATGSGPADAEAAARRRWRTAMQPLGGATTPGPDAWRWSAPV
jgi:hypothetical protein